MHIELTESLVCPRCRPAQGLVALVDRISDRRIREGSLGCPSCERRYPIRDGDVRFDAPVGGPSERESGSPAVESSPDETDETPTPGRVAEPGRGSGEASGPREDVAVPVAALLGLAQEDRGPLVLGRGLAAAASGIAELTPSAEVIALVGERDEGGAGGDGADRPLRLTLFHGAREDRLPFGSGRLRGVALLGGTAPAVRDAARALAPGGRLTVLRPSPEVAALLESPETVADLHPLAVEERAAVAVRR